MSLEGNNAEQRLRTIEIFEELYDEFEFLAAIYSELDEEAMSIFDLYDSGIHTAVMVNPKWEDMVKKVAEVINRSAAVAGLIQGCRERLGEVYGTGKGRESCLRLLTDPSGQATQKEHNETKDKRTYHDRG